MLSHTHSHLLGNPNPAGTNLQPPIDTLPRTGLWQSSAGALNAWVHSPHCSHLSSAVVTSAGSTSPRVNTKVPTGQPWPPPCSWSPAPQSPHLLHGCPLPPPACYPGPRARHTDPSRWPSSSSTLRRLREVMPQTSVPHLPVEAWACWVGAGLTPGQSMCLESGLLCVLASSSHLPHLPRMEQLQGRRGCEWAGALRQPMPRCLLLLSWGKGLSPKGLSL